MAHPILRACRPSHGTSWIWGLNAGPTFPIDNSSRACYYGVLPRPPWQSQLLTFLLFIILESWQHMSLSGCRLQRCWRWPDLSNPPVYVATTCHIHHQAMFLRLHLHLLHDKLFILCGEDRSTVPRSKMTEALTLQP